MKTVELGSESTERAISMAEILKIIWKARKTTVLTGAGISCNAGIPDFRLLDGLYLMVKKKHPELVVRGQDLFDISLFRDSKLLLVFCTFMEALHTSTMHATPTETHRFIKTLKDKGKLLRCYTQNIDGLEAMLNLNTGLRDEHLAGANAAFTKSWRDLDVIQLHGDLRKLLCTHCFTQCNWTREYKRQLLEGENPSCLACHAKYLERLYLGKRLTGNVGLLRPLIVLYGENHPQAEHLARGLNTDLRLRPDLLIIMGTSLKVDGVKKLVRLLASAVKDKGGKVIFVNKTPASGMWKDIIDYQVLCDCDAFVRSVKQEIPDLFLTQEQLDLNKLNNAMTPPTTPLKVKTKTAGGQQPPPQIKLEFEAALVKIKKEREALLPPTPALTPANSFDEKPLRAKSMLEINMAKRGKEPTVAPSKRIKLETR